MAHIEGPATRGGQGMMQREKGRIGAHAFTKVCGWHVLGLLG